MKIAMIVPSLANKGPVIVAKDLCEEFVKMGHECKMFYFDAIYELEMPCAVERISLWESIDFSQWDIIHTHGLRPDFYVRLHRLARKDIHTKFITTQHNPISIKELNQTYNLIASIIVSVLWHIALTSFDKIIYLNPITMHSTTLFKNVVKDVIYNGRDISTSQNSLQDAALLNLKQDYHIIGTISGIEKRKGLEQMLHALQHLPQCMFCCVGRGDELPKLQALAKELGVHEQCYWAGYHKDAHMYHKYFDIFVMCSRSEGFPLALIEAGAYGSPTILSNIPILRSIISEPNVEFYELDNTPDLVCKIKKVLKDKDSYSSNIRTYYNANLLAKHMADNYLKTYKTA